MRYNVFSDLAVPGRHGKSSTFRLVGAWLSLVEHSVRDRGVGGSNPLAPTNFPRFLPPAPRATPPAPPPPPVCFFLRRPRPPPGPPRARPVATPPPPPRAPGWRGAGVRRGAPSGPPPVRRRSWRSGPSPRPLDRAAAVALPLFGASAVGPPLGGGGGGGVGWGRPPPRGGLGSRFLPPSRSLPRPPVFPDGCGVLGRRARPAGPPSRSSVACEARCWGGWGWRPLVLVTGGGGPGSGRAPVPPRGSPSRCWAVAAPPPQAVVVGGGEPVIF